MPRRIESLFIEGPAGKLEALLEEPEDRDPNHAVLVCHPHPQHGGTMHNKVVYRIARGMRRTGAVVLRFNYRGVNLSQGQYDHGIGEVEPRGSHQVSPSATTTYTLSASGGTSSATSTVKVIVGVNDAPALSADVMEQTWLTFFPEAEMTILSDAGHYPMFESPVSLATSIEEFLGRD